MHKNWNEIDFIQVRIFSLAYLEFSFFLREIKKKKSYRKFEPIILGGLAREKKKTQKILNKNIINKYGSTLKAEY